MDGLASAFLRDLDDMSTLTSPAPDGILYLEDFDVQESDDAHAAESNALGAQAVAPIITVADLEAAREEGRLSGVSATLDDAKLLQAQIQAAAMQGIADSLAASETLLQRITRETTEEGVRTVIALLHAALPTLMERHATGEAVALLEALLPGISLEPELRIRTHPTLTDHARELVAGALRSGQTILSVSPDPELAPGDVHVEWRDGSARRDTAQIWNAIGRALASLNLPPIEELCRDCRC